MTGMPIDDAPSGVEPKRRLSLRLHDIDKRVKAEDRTYRRGRSGSATKDFIASYEESAVGDGPSTSTSSSARFHIPPSTSAGSSETDDGSEWASHRPHSQRSPRVPPPSQRPVSDSRRSTWLVDEGGAASGSQTRTGPFKDSAGPGSERMPSPPSMLLSSGQPIVNPPLKTQAAFVGKLYSMLEDDEIRRTGLLYWANNGTTFICPNPTEFSKAILPRFFKHNNWQSFVRQLNMYSFNKVNDLYATSSDPTAWEFRHPSFRQGEPHLLSSIKRKSTRNSTHDGQSVVSPSEEMSEARAMAGWMRDPNAVSASAAAAAASGHMTLGMHGGGQGGYQREPPRQVFGYDIRTGETIESRPYELTARASTREYFENVRRADGQGQGQGGGRVVSLNTPDLERQYSGSERDFANRETQMARDRETSRGREPRDRSRDRPQPLMLQHGGGMSGPPPYAGEPYTSYYPQPSGISHALTQSQYSPSHVERLSAQVTHLQEENSMLNDQLNQHRIDSAKRELDLVAYSIRLTSWLPTLSESDARQVQELLSRDSANRRRDYEALVAMASRSHTSQRGPESQLYPNPAMPVSHPAGHPSEGYRLPNDPRSSQNQSHIGALTLPAPHPSQPQSQGAAPSSRPFTSFDSDYHSSRQLPPPRPVSDSRTLPSPQASRGAALPIPVILPPPTPGSLRALSGSLEHSDRSDRSGFGILSQGNAPRVAQPAAPPPERQTEKERERERDRDRDWGRDREQQERDNGKRLELQEQARSRESRQLAPNGEPIGQMVDSRAPTSRQRESGQSPMDSHREVEDDGGADDQSVVDVAETEPVDASARAPAGMRNLLN